MNLLLYNIRRVKKFLQLKSLPFTILPNIKWCLFTMSFDTPSSILNISIPSHKSLPKRHPVEHPACRF